MAMQLLKDRILKDGKVIGNDILKVDLFVNHQIDTKLLDEVGSYLARHFEGVTKILTIETSGIAFACATAFHINYAPVVFAKKVGSRILDANNVYQTEVKSYTKGIVSNVSVDKRFLTSEDKVLIIDDFLATGNAVLGLVDLCKQAGATIVGAGIVIEKGFQPGRQILEGLGLKVVSAAIVDHFEDGKVVFKD